MGDLCNELLELYESTQYLATFPDIHNISPVRDPDEVAELNKRLLEAVRSRSEDLFLAVPEIVDYSESSFAKFTGAGKSKLYDDVHLAYYYEYLESHEIPPTSIGLETLKRHRLVLTDENGSTRDPYPFLKCLIYDTSLGGESAETFHFNDGSWYKVDTAYVGKLKSYLDPYCEDLVLPDYHHSGESEYNEAVAKKNSAYLCFDRKNIAPAGYGMIEPCDLYSVVDGNAVMSHVKRSTRSTMLSHLFNQGANALELLKQEEESVERLKALIDAVAHETERTEFKLPLTAKKFLVEFAIISHKDKAKKSDNLPLFSRVSLMRVIKSINLMNVSARYGFVRESFPKSKGTKLPKQA